MKIGYGKLGRSMPLTLDKCGNLGGDVECVAVVKELALRHPDDLFYLLGRNSGEDPEEVGLPPNVINMWSRWQPMLRAYMTANGIKGNMTINQHKQLLKFYESLTQPVFEYMDGHVWWVGQHGSSNSPIPMTNGSGQLTKPHDSYSFYCAFVFQGLNAWRDKDPFTREEVYLNADARNRHKMRDLKWPLKNPILTQYNFTNNITHERYGDITHPNANWHGVSDMQNPYRWVSVVDNIYARLEINGLAPGTPFGDLISFNDTWENRDAFGMFINEARAQGIGDEKKRVNVMKKWVLPLYTTMWAPSFIHGTWSDASQEALQLDIDPAPWNQYYPKLHSVRATFTTPSSGSGWATAKPWEAFAGGTVCFFHPDYDDQDNILDDAPSELRHWLRVKTPLHLESNIRAVNEDRELWLNLVHVQRAHFNRAMKEKRYLRLIEERIWG